LHESPQEMMCRHSLKINIEVTSDNNVKGRKRNARKLISALREHDTFRKRVECAERGNEAQRTGSLNLHSPGFLQLRCPGGMNTNGPSPGHTLEPLGNAPRMS